MLLKNKMTNKKTGFGTLNNSGYEVSFARSLHPNCQSCFLTSATSHIFKHCVTEQTRLFVLLYWSKS